MEGYKHFGNHQSMVMVREEEKIIEVLYSQSHVCVVILKLDGLIWGFGSAYVEHSTRLGLEFWGSNIDNLKNVTGYFLYGADCNGRYSLWDLKKQSLMLWGKRWSLRL